MSKIHLLILLLIITVQNNCYANDIVQKRIVGGDLVFDINSIPNELLSERTTTMEKWPWMVAISDGHIPFCGASLIDRQWLLTAAHCLYDLDTGELIGTNVQKALFLQADLLYPVEQSFSRNIVSYIIHPQYDFNRDLNDIALLKLDRPVDSIEPITIVGSSYDENIIATDTLSTVLGWGDTQSSDDVNYFLMLRKVEVPVAAVDICRQSLAKNNTELYDSMLCAGYEQGGKDSCSGDSGGPLVVYSEPLQAWMQIGIVSFGIGCALPDEYGIYTRLSKFNAIDQFIQQNICVQTDSAPHINIVRNTNKFTVQLSNGENNTDYRLYYAPYPSMTPINYLDIVASHELSVELPAEQQYFVAAQSRNGNCTSYFSEIVTVNVD